MGLRLYSIVWPFINSYAQTYALDAQDYYLHWCRLVAQSPTCVQLQFSTSIWIQSNLGWGASCKPSPGWWRWSLHAVCQPLFATLVAQTLVETTLYSRSNFSGDHIVVVLVNNESQKQFVRNTSACQDFSCRLLSVADCLQICDDDFPQLLCHSC